MAECAAERNVNICAILTLMKGFTALVLLLGIVLTGCSSAERGGRGDHQTSAAAGLPAGAKVIDVRTPEEFASGHVQGAINVPVDQVETRIAQVAPDKNAPLYVHCQSGGRSARAISALNRMGYKHVTDLGSLANARKTVESK